MSQWTLKHRHGNQYYVEGIEGCSAIFKEADARLIAAAPELLQALINLLDNPWPAEGIQPASRFAKWEQAVEQARAAITKAVG